MAAIILVLEARVLPGKRDDLENFLRDARPFYESIGDVTMRFMWDAHDQQRFREIFEYRTQEVFDLDDHRVHHDPTMTAYLSKWRTLLEGEVQVSVWNERHLQA